MTSDEIVRETRVRISERENKGRKERRHIGDKIRKSKKAKRNNREKREPEK